jgi:vacuolar protein sorting-associated protein 29
MYGERLQINPGSATGAYSSLNAEVRPSFVLMDVDGAKVGGT